MTTLFISDLHLEPQHPAMAELFIQWLTERAVKAEALYILGDFFEVWLGDDEKSAFSTAIKAALNKVTQAGLAVYLMHGNRDFLLGTKFLAQTGCQLLVDPTLINLYGKQTLLMHGDTLCLDDKGYLRLRKIVRNPLVQRIFLRLPTFLRKKIARRLRTLSQQQANQTNFVFYDASVAEIKRLMLQQQAQLIIHGHTHQPCIQFFPLADKLGQRVVLSDWEKKGNVLECTADGQLRLLDIR